MSNGLGEEMWMGGWTGKTSPLHVQFMHRVKIMHNMCAIVHKLRNQGNTISVQI
jgi:hypothetical protein